MSSDELRPGWVWVSLADVLSEPLVNGRSVRTFEGGFPVLRLTALKPGGIDFNERKDGAWTKEQAAPYLVSEGDFLLSRGNGSRKLVGRGSLVHSVPVDVAFPDTMIRVRTRSDAVAPGYLKYVWESPIIRGQIEKAARTTAGIYKINQGILENVTFPLPPLAEQHRIVEALEDHLSVLDAAQSRVEHGLARIAALIGGIRNTITQARDSLAILPDGWAWGELGDVLERIEAGKSFQCEARPATDEEWGVIKVSAMTWGEFRAEEQKAIPSGRDFDPRHEIRQNDILISRANTPQYVGAPVLVKECRPRLLLSDKSLRLIPKQGVDRSWLLQVLASPFARKQISSKASGSKESMRNISQKALTSIQIPIPPTDRQIEIGESVSLEVERVGRLADTLRTTQIRAAHLRRALLARAFTGSLVAQDPTEVPSFALLESIRAEQNARPKSARALRPRKAASALPSDSPPPPLADSTPAPRHAVQQELPL